MEKLRARPRVGSAFYKAHGHGNDYLVFDAGDGPTVTETWVRRVCDRWRGVGGDGVVVVAEGAGEDVASLRMFNPDGSEFERSGNGLRVAALHLASGGRVDSGPFTVSVGGDRLRMTVGARNAGGGAQVTVEMGEVAFPRSAPFVRAGSLQDGWISLGDGVRCVPVSVGNPHAVVFGDAWDDTSFHRLGPWIATHADFPEGTNVQFVGAIEDRTVPIRIWERGVGPTSSSGTSACAAAAAAVRTGRLSPGPVEVRMEGGSFRVTVGDDWQVVLEGPVEPVCAGHLEAALMRAGQDGS